MDSTDVPSPPGAPSRLSMVGAFAAIALGLMVLVGWTIGSDRLISFDLRFIAMLPNSAFGMVAGGTAILLLHDPGSRTRVLWARVLAAAIIALGLLSVLSRLTGTELLFVGGLFRERVARYPYLPVGIMATNSGVVFTLTGLALILMTGGDRKRQAARALAALNLGATTIALLGHLYGARVLFAVDRFAGMALITALAFAWLQIGILFLRPFEGAVSLVSSNDLAGRLMRRLLPLTVVVPISMGLMLIEGREESLFSRETGVAMFVVLLSAWIIGVLLFNARFIRDAEEARTRLLEREQHLRAMAETANKTKSEFLGVMSHELRTPLNAIVGYVDLLHGGVAGPVTDAQRNHLDRIRTSANHLTRTVSDILTLSRLESGVGAVRIEPVPLSAALDDVAAVLEPLARAKGLQFSCACSLPMTVHADPHRLRQIVINLGANAIKFTRAGSVSINAALDGDRALVEVRDSGIGIAASDLERIFEEFWQVEGALTRSFDGAGLGLAVSRRLARQLGGDITVTSELGRGSSFLLTLRTVTDTAPASSLP